MKKALVALAFAAFASSAFAAVANGPHDLSTAGINATTYPGGSLSACQYCHAPHNVNTGVPGAPLWNRNTTGGTFNMYTSPTLAGTRAASPQANSMTCLSCHDGVSDMGATYTGGRGFAGNTVMVNIGAGRQQVVGTNLRNDHPISIAYTAGTYYAAVNAVTVRLKLYDYGSGNQVECGSCHNPHDNQYTNFLRMQASAICTTCHLY